MKLNIGENIRKRRRELELTQEQLGEELGVSYQAISRWENGTAYPDIEFLPTLARFFEMTVDELIGCGEDERKKRADELIGQLEHGGQDVEQVIKMIRELRREHLLDCGTEFWFSMEKYCRIPAVLNELRMTAEAILDKSTSKYLREWTIYYMAQYEDEAHIGDFLKKHAASLDISYNSLCHSRYAFRRETDKYEIYNQIRLRETVTELVGNFQMGENDRCLTAEELLRVCRFQLACLNWFCRTEPTEDHPVFCDDIVDEWSIRRVPIGLDLAGCLASIGDKEGAFAVLEDVVAMLEKIMDLLSRCSDGCTEINVRCEWLDKAKVKLRRYSDGSSEPVEPVMLVNEWKIGEFEIFEGGTGPLDNRRAF